MNTKISCKACILCGSHRVERRQRVLSDFLKMRAAKFQCHHCHGILYRKNRLANLLGKSHQSTESMAHSGH